MITASALLDKPVDLIFITFVQFTEKPLSQSFNVSQIFSGKMLIYEETTSAPRVSMTNTCKLRYRPVLKGQILKIVKILEIAFPIR